MFGRIHSLKKVVRNDYEKENTCNACLPQRVTESIDHDVAIHAVYCIPEKLLVVHQK